MKYYPNQWKQRAGVTLMEALVALGILSIGLIALLTFFPLAAVQMAHSFKDDRTTSLAASQMNLAQMMWRLSWVDANGNRLAELNPPGSTANSVFTIQPGLLSMDLGIQNVDPNAHPAPLTISTIATQGTNIANNFSNYNLSIHSNGPGYPVLIDPIGVSTRSALGLDQYWVGVSTGGFQGVARASWNIPPAMSPNLQTAGIGSAAQMIRYFGLMDDMIFGPGGGADLTSGAVQRLDQYNASWLLQRPVSSNRTEVDIQIITYLSRPLDIPSTETVVALSAPLVAGANNVSVSYPIAAGTLPMPRNTWFMVVNSSTQSVADFYRAVSVTDVTHDGSGNEVYNIETQLPIKPSSASGDHIIIFQGIAEVFDMGIVGITTPPHP